MPSVLFIRILYLLFKSTFYIQIIIYIRSTYIYIFSVTHIINFIFSIYHYLLNYLMPSEPILPSSLEDSFVSIAIVA